MPHYLITHGDRFFGPNPGHTSKGIKQIRTLQIPDDINLVVVGTGIRFQEIYEAIKPQIPGVPVKYSPFCGSADGLEGPETDYSIILVNRKLVSQNNYLGLIETPGFDAWGFVANLPNRTLICAGGELLIALGLKAINEKGQLYELDLSIKDGWKIS